MTQHGTIEPQETDTIDPAPPESKPTSDHSAATVPPAPAAGASSGELRGPAAEDALEAILREPAPLPPQWPAAKALWATTLWPRNTATHTQRVPLKTAWLLHMGAAFLAFAAILLCVSIDDANTFSPLPVLTGAWRLLGELPAEFSQDPAMATLGLVLLIGIIELGFAALGVIVSPWGARDERPMATIRNGLRRVWLSSGHLVLAIFILGLTISSLENARERWIAGNPEPPFVWDGPKLPTLAPDDPGYAEAMAKFADAQAEFTKKRADAWASRSEWHARMPWHIDNREPICVATGFANFGWFLFILLRGVGAPRRIRTRWTDPICGHCGVELGDLAPDERCGGCGVDPSDEPSKYDALDTRCIDCGYNLTGMTDDDRCPECGKPHPESTKIGLFCHKCGYDLRGSEAQGACSECGTAVSDSVRALADHGVRRRVLGGAFLGSWKLLLSAIRDPQSLGRDLVLTNDKTWHRRVLAAHLPLIFLVASLVIPTIAILMGGARMAREELAMMAIVGCVFGMFCVFGALLFVLLAAGIVGLGLSARAGRNLAAPAMQVACVFAGYLLVWEIFGAGLGITFAKLIDIEFFRDLSERIGFSPDFLTSAGWFIPNAAIGLFFMTLVWKTAWASRFSNH